MNPCRFDFFIQNINCTIFFYNVYANTKFLFTRNKILFINAIFLREIKILFINAQYFLFDSIINLQIIIIIKNN